MAYRSTPDRPTQYGKDWLVPWYEPPATLHLQLTVGFCIGRCWLEDLSWKLWACGLLLGFFAVYILFRLPPVVYTLFKHAQRLPPESETQQRIIRRTIVRQILLLAGIFFATSSAVVYWFVERSERDGDCADVNAATAACVVGVSSLGTILFLCMGLTQHNCRLWKIALGTWCHCHRCEPLLRSGEAEFLMSSAEDLPSQSNSQYDG